MVVIVVFVTEVKLNKQGLLVYHQMVCVCVCLVLEETYVFMTT